MEKLFLQKISSKNFRNLNIEKLEFNKKLTCVFGENRQGKTNLLEMIYYIFNKKSFKKKCSFSQLLTIDGEKTEFIISAVVKNQDVLNLLAIKENKAGQTCYLNGEIREKNNIGKNIFILVPSDAYNFFMNRLERLTWVDDEICRLKNDHSKNLYKYYKGLRQRNYLLSSIKKDKVQITSLTKVISPYACRIQDARQLFLREINKHSDGIYRDLFSANEQLSISMNEKIKYLSNCPDKYAVKWLNYYDEEIEKGVSKYGPHLDDIEIKINGFPIISHGSLGQQKMAFFSLFFSGLKLNFSKKYENQNILILLDDISSEIDSLRLKSLIKYLLNQRCQVILTTANKNLQELVLNEVDSEVIIVDNGKFEIKK